MARNPSVITKSNSAITDAARGSFQKDPMWRPGTKFILDFCDEFGANPNSAGVLATGSKVYDLGLTPAEAVVNTPGFTSLADHAGITTAGGVLQTITLGAAGDFDIPVDREFLFLFWAKQTAAGAANTPMMYLGPPGSTNGNNSQVYVTLGAGGNTIGIQVGTGSSIRNQSFAADVAAGAPTQLGLSYRPADGQIRRVQNGVMSNPATLGGLNLLDGSAMVFQLTSRFIGTHYRIQLIDMTEAVATETAWGYAADEILDATAHAAKDYLFCTGALPEAPRTAFA